MSSGFTCKCVDETKALPMSYINKVMDDPENIANARACGKEYTLGAILDALLDELVIQRSVHPERLAISIKEKLKASAAPYLR